MITTVRGAREFLPFGYGFAAGAVVSLVASKFIIGAPELGEGLPDRGYRELGGGLVVGGPLMLPLAFLGG